MVSTLLFLLSLAPPAVCPQYMQKKNPMYSVLKEDTVWSMEKLNDYVNDTYSVAKGLPRDWITGDFTVSLEGLIMILMIVVVQGSV